MHPKTPFEIFCFLGLSCALSIAQEVAPTPPSTPTDNLKRVPANAYESTPAIGIPHQSLFRETRAPYLDTLRDYRLSPEAQLTESVEASSSIDLPDFRGRFPLLQRGFAPEDADLKIGPLYFKLRHISGALLFSDNINRSDENKESDAIGIVSIGGQILAQLSEGFRLAIAGNFVYLPSEGEAGFSGYALQAPYSFGIAANPSARAQVAWEPVLFGQPFVIADEFRLGLARFSNTTYDGFDVFEGGDFDEDAQAGIYTLRAPRDGRERDFRDRPDQNEFEQIYYSNEVSIATSGRLPGDNIFRLRASHTDFWFDEDDRFRFPDSINTVRASIESNREDLRFKPYISYRLLHRDNPDRLSHRILGGLRGPITDLLNLDAGIGYSLVSTNDNEGLRWRVQLDHRPSPYTRQYLTYSRDTNDFQDEVEERIRYRIRKTLGPDLTASAYAGYHWVEDIDNLNPDREEFRTGIRFNYIISPKSSASLSGQYASISYDDGIGDVDTLRIRAEYRRKLYERISARLIYQFTDQNADVSVRDYQENLLYLSFSWLIN